MKQEHFNLVIVDADTAVFRAAKATQEDYVIVTHIESGREKEFSTKTEFWGHWKKKEGGWLAEQNEERQKKGLEPWKVDHFEVEQFCRLIDLDETDFDDHLSLAETQFDFFIGGIKQLPADDYKLCIGGKKNFRYDEAHILPYKGERKDKPILFTEVREMLMKKYHTKFEVCEGEEADDKLGQYGYENFLHHKKTGKWKYLLSFIDKDLKMIVSPYVNYEKKEEGITFVTPLMGAKHFCVQLLMGDKQTDNIQGLPKLTEDLQNKYGLRKSKGIGETTAVNFLKDCTDIKSLFERVVEAYKAYYGEEEFDFESHRGEKSKRTWLDMLRENALLLWMRRTPDEMYDIEDTLKRLGVDY